MRYNASNFIRQFVTILSLNKTRNLMGAVRLFLFWGAVTYCTHFSF